MFATISTTKKDILSRDFTRAKILHVSENGVDLSPLGWNWAELHRLFILQVPTEIVLQKTGNVKRGPPPPPSGRLDSPERTNARPSKKKGWKYDTGIPQLYRRGRDPKEIIKDFYKLEDSMDNRLKSVIRLQSGQVITLKGCSRVSGNE
jgi:hypothetical protein